jgi:hypothetical protein
MAIEVQSFAGTSLISGTGYFAWLGVDDAPFSRQVQSVFHRPPGRHPNLVRTQQQEHTFPLHVTITSGSLQTQRDALAGLFRKGVTGDLIVKFDESLRKLSCTVTRVLPYDKSANQFTAILTAPDPRWKSSLSSTFNNGGIQFSGDLINDTLRSAGDEGDGIAPIDGGSTGIWQGTTNLCDNGSIETTTDGWSTFGTNGIAKTSLISKFGSSSLLVSYGNNANLARHDNGGIGISFGAGRTYIFSAWVYLPSGWDGGDVRVRAVGLGSNVTESDYQDADGTLTDTWQHVQCVGLVTSADTGGIRLQALGTPSGGKLMAIDGVQIEEVSGAALLKTGTPFVETDGASASRDAARVQVNARDMEEAEGWRAFRVRLDWVSDETNTKPDAYLMSWEVDASNRIDLRYDDATETFIGRRSNSGSDDTVSVAATVSRQQFFTVVFAWESGELKLSVDGSAFTTASTSAGTPDLSSAPLLDIGNRGGASQLGGDVVWAVGGNGTLTDTDAENFHLDGGGAGNLLKMTEQLDDTGTWARTGTNPPTLFSTDTENDPDGNATAEVFDFGTTQSVLRQSSIGLANGTTYNLSVYCKIEDAGGALNLNLNVDNGSSSLAVADDGSWHRVNVDAVAGASDLFDIEINPAASRRIALWGAQVTEGSGVQDYGRVSAGNDPPVDFEAAAQKDFEWDGSGLGDAGSTSFKLFNSGNTTEDQAVFTVKPTAAKAASASWIYKREVVVANRVKNVFSDYAIELTDGGWDHATEVGAGRSLSSGNDVRVLVDGVEVPRWDGGGSSTSWNDSGTKIWANLNLSAALIAEKSAQTLPSDGGEWLVHKGTAGWPENGAFLIEDEVVEYTGKTATSFLNVSRGARGTSSAGHSDGTPMYFVEHRVQIVYGWTGSGAPEDNDDRQPMIDLDDSTNTTHVWADFAHATDPRSMQWSRSLVESDTFQDRILAATGSPADELTFYYNNLGAQPGKPNFNAWTRPIPSGTGSSGGDVVDATVTGTGFNLYLGFGGGNAGALDLGLYGVSSDGAEFLIANKGLVDDGAQDFDASSTAYSLQFRARSFIAAQAPFGAEGTHGEIASPGATILRQPFIVPSSSGKTATVLGISMLLRHAGSSSTDSVLTVSLSKSDGADSPTYNQIASKQETITFGVGAGSLVGNSTFLEAAFEFDTPVVVTPGDTLYIELEWDSGTDVSDIEWYQYLQSYAGASEVYDFRVYSRTLDFDEAAGQLDEQEITIDDLSVYLSSSGVPYVGFGSQESAYFLDGTLTNTTTGQSVALYGAVDVDDVIEVDVDLRRVKNLTTGQRVPFMATLSDKDRWIDLEAGDNAFTYTEDGLVSVELAATYSHRWEA